MAGLDEIGIWYWFKSLEEPFNFRKVGFRSWIVSNDKDFVVWEDIEGWHCECQGMPSSRSHRQECVHIRALKAHLGE